MSDLKKRYEKFITEKLSGAGLLQADVGPNPDPAYTEFWAQIVSSSETPKISPTLIEWSEDIWPEITPDWTEMEPLSLTQPAFWEEGGGVGGGTGGPPPPKVAPEMFKLVATYPKNFEKSDQNYFRLILDGLSLREGNTRRGK